MKFLAVEKSRLLRPVNSTGEAYVTSYFALVGEYPKTINDLKTPPNGIPPFVKRASDLEDPWGKPMSTNIRNQKYRQFRHFHYCPWNSDWKLGYRKIS